MEKSYGIIYKATNKINNKTYIGQTSKKFSKRKIDHKSRANTRNFAISAIYSAINKYGWPNFIWEIIEDCYSKEELDEMEYHYIMQYDTYNNGYNLTLGGDGGGCGYKHTKETKQKMSELKNGMYFGKDNPFYGKTHSDEFKKFQSDNKSKEYIITFPNGSKEKIKNLTKFCKIYKLDRRQMHRVMKGNVKQGHHKGYKCEKCPVSI